MDLVHNERMKLLATFINSMAIAVIAVGGFAPIYSRLGETLQINPLIVFNAIYCMAAGCCMHVLASLLLKRLKP